MSRGLWSIWTLVLGMVAVYKVQSGPGAPQQDSWLAEVLALCSHDILCPGHGISVLLVPLGRGIQQEKGREQGPAPWV